MLPGFRGYQITATMSALGQKRTSAHIQSMSALPPKADMDQHRRDVRFVPKADMEVHSSTSSAIALGCFEKG